MTKVTSPGSHAPLIAGDNNQVLVIGAAERDELMRCGRKRCRKWRKSCQVNPAKWPQFSIPIIHLSASTRLRIELLRAHLPNRFKTLGSGAPLVAGDNNQVVICDAAEREVDCCSAGSAGGREPAAIKSAKWRIYRFW
jgi:hypothetical protein